MLTEFGILKPDVPRAGYSEECYELWRQERRQSEREFQDPYEGFTRIRHDSNWRGRFWSVQCARDVASGEIDFRNPAHYGWLLVEVLFYGAWASWVMGGAALMLAYGSVGKIGGFAMHIGAIAVFLVLMNWSIKRSDIVRFS